MQTFQAIHLASTGTVQQGSHRWEERRKIIRLMGFPACQSSLLK
ncbi:hypothetical protein [Phormidium sp. FACHB-1136]|nr:hypothetical protein [Phormidium sp. FACHB-1136]